MTEQEFKELKKKAVSFTTLNPPDDAELVHTEQTELDSYYYYQTEEGKAYYESKSGQQFKEWIENSKKKKRFAATKRFGANKI